MAVIGATFAYFTAQRGDGAQADITVTTSTSDSIVYGSFEPLMVKATQQNFDQEKMNSQRGSTEGTITITASDNEDRQDEADYCYTSTLKVSKNDFIYKPKAEDTADPEVSQENKPELLLNLYLDDENYTQTPLVDLSYKTIEGQKKVCDQKNGAVPEDEICEEETLAGYDITEFGKNSTPDEDPVTPTVDLKIPVKDGDADSLQDLIYVHHIKAEGAGTQKEVKWKATITFVNYDFDQQYNTNKEFIATWVFTPVECATGTPINPDDAP